jgi:phage terminase small subunit
MADKLTLKQQRFIDFYLGEARGNATEAARLAGYASPHPEGARLRQNATVRARIDERLMAQSLSSAEVLAELTSVAMADWQNFVQVRTNPRTGEVVDAKVVLADKVKALELLGKYHRLFTDKTELGGDVGFLDALRAFGRSGS